MSIMATDTTTAATSSRTGTLWPEPSPYTAEAMARAVASNGDNPLRSRLRAMYEADPSALDPEFGGDVDLAIELEIALMRRPLVCSLHRHQTSRA